MNDPNPSQPHTLPSRTSRHASQNLAKNVSAQPHDRQTNGRRKRSTRR
jgi:hypothetical protein